MCVCVYVFLPFCLLYPLASCRSLVYGHSLNFKWLGSVGYFNLKLLLRLPLLRLYRGNCCCCCSFNVSFFRSFSAIRDSVFFFFFCITSCSYGAWVSLLTIFVNFVYISLLCFFLLFSHTKIEAVALHNRQPASFFCAIANFGNSWLFYASSFCFTVPLALHRKCLYITMLLFIQIKRLWRCVHANIHRVVEWSEW